jgi:hypothetical protein
MFDFSSAEYALHVPSFVKFSRSLSSAFAGLKDIAKKPSDFVSSEHLAQHFFSSHNCVTSFSQHAGSSTLPV